MPEDRSGSGDDPTLTPSQAIGVAATSASLEDAPRAPATGALPARYQLGRQLAVRAGDPREVRARVGVVVLAARLLVLREQLQDVRHGSPPVSLPSSSSSLKRRWKRDAIW